MGEIKSSLEKISDKYHWYFFLIGDYVISTRVNDFFNYNFKVIGSAIGENAVIVRRTDNSRIEREIQQLCLLMLFIRDKFDSFFGQAFKEENKPGLLITDQHPSSWEADSKLAYISFSALEEKYGDINELLRDIVSFAKSDDYTMLKRTASERNLISGVSLSINFDF